MPLQRRIPKRGFTNIRRVEFQVVNVRDLNRLDAGIKLDADPTVQYPLGQPGDWWPDITTDDYVAVDSPWNTYLYVGLPPSPIANPGLGSVRAVLAPDDTPFIFFMRDCDADDGSHLFATNQEEHLANYARCVGP